MSPAGEEPQLVRASWSNSKDRSTQQRLFKVHTSGESSAAASPGRKETPTKHVWTRSTVLSAPYDKPLHSGEISSAKPNPSIERGTFIKWLAAVPERLSSNASRGQSKVTSALNRHQARVPAVESRIGHFLSSLPEEATGYEDALFDLNGAPKPPIRSPTTPDLADTQIEAF